jgi:hypothetical protein
LTRFIACDKHGQRSEDGGGKRYSVDHLLP